MGNGVGPGSYIQVRNATGGSISNNTITNNGYNASPGTGTSATDPSWVAAIRLEGSSNIVVSGNSITTPTTTGSYNGFGILTVDSLANSSSAYSKTSYSAAAAAAATSTSNLISTNIVHSYNGATYRGQNRRINLAPGDTSDGNIDTP
jgi:hypothetical protein